MRFKFRNRAWTFSQLSKLCLHFGEDTYEKDFRFLFVLRSKTAFYSRLPTMRGDLLGPLFRATKLQSQNASKRLPYGESFVPPFYTS